MEKGCKGCQWEGNCVGMQRCSYFTPQDYDDRIAEREERRGFERFRDEWEEYMDYIEHGDYFF